MIMPRMHSNNEEWIKPGIVEACNLYCKRLAGFFLGRGIYLSHEKCKKLKGKVSNHTEPVEMKTHPGHYLV